MDSQNKNDLIVNELLFFISNKLHSTTKDDIISMCVSFYSLEEVHDAIATLESALTIRLTKRHKSDELLAS